MSGRERRPPRLSRHILEWSARRLGTPELADDAAELFVARSRREGVRAARRWYGRQARASLWRVVRPARRGAASPRRPGWLTGISLDARLGARMLVKHPGVSVVGGAAMVIGVGLGAGYLEFVNDFMHPTLPLDEGERIVGIQVWDVAENEPELRTAHDFVAWREAIGSIQDLGAFRSVRRNLGPGAGPAEPARGAEVSPSSFAALRAPALMGRTLGEADAREGAPRVIVLGHDLWQSRFSADTAIVGRTVHLGGVPSTVVGVMPDGFGFPVSHDFWTPLGADALREWGPREGPALQLFGRLAPDVTREEAQAELTALGQRAAADLPATHESLRPRVVPYADLFLRGVTGGAGQEMHLVQLVFVALLVLLSSNVAVMVFARSATRENEIAMRFALGSSRGRIVAQFFVEALVLALAATAVGLAVVAWGAAWFTRFVWEVAGGGAPFWLDGRLNLTTVLYASGLAVLASLVAGAIPALKATGSRLQARLRDSAGAGDSSLRFGGLWSVMIVAQVALAVVVLPPAVIAVAALAEPGFVEPGFPGERYLSAEIAMDVEGSPVDLLDEADRFSAFRATYDELERRLLAEPEVPEVTFATRLPVMNHPQPWVEVEREGEVAPDTAVTWAMATSVDLDFFETFGADIVAGRGFSAVDLEPDPRVVVVNEHFVTEILQGRNAVGRRLRYSTRFGQREATGQPRTLSGVSPREPGPWYEIVGVVSGLGMDTNRDPFYPGRGPGVYHPLVPAAMGSGGSYTIRMAFPLRGDVASFAPRVREIAHAVDPELRVQEVLPMDGPIDEANRSERVVSRFFSWMTALVGVIALLISTAGTYSVMSFTVSRQTREIGIRVALGADHRRIVTGVFSRAMLQIGAGLVVGVLVWLGIFLIGLGAPDEVDLLVLAAAVLALVGLVACGVPVRRALRIQPVEALREVG